MLTFTLNKTCFIVTENMKNGQLLILFTYKTKMCEFYCSYSYRFVLLKVFHLSLSFLNLLYINLSFHKTFIDHTFLALINMYLYQGHRERRRTWGWVQGGANTPHPPPFPGAKIFFPRKIGKQNFSMRITCEAFVYLMSKT